MSDGAIIIGQRVAVVVPILSWHLSAAWHGDWRFSDVGVSMIDPKDVPSEVAKAAWEYFDGYDMKEAIAAAINTWVNIYPETRPDRWMQVTLFFAEKSHD